jgi:hypothetical protein
MTEEYVVGEGMVRDIRKGMTQPGVVGKTTGKGRPAMGGSEYWCWCQCQHCTVVIIQETW